LSPEDTLIEYHEFHGNRFTPGDELEKRGPGSWSEHTNPGPRFQLVPGVNQGSRRCAFRRVRTADRNLRCATSVRGADPTRIAPRSFFRARPCRTSSARIIGIGFLRPGIDAMCLSTPRLIAASTFSVTSSKEKRSQRGANIRLAFPHARKFPDRVFRTRTR